MNSPVPGLNQMCGQENVFGAMEIRQQRIPRAGHIKDLAKSQMPSLLQSILNRPNPITCFNWHMGELRTASSEMQKAESRQSEDRIDNSIGR